METNYENEIFGGACGGSGLPDDRPGISGIWI
jgi:hypothetical protein